MSDTLSAIHTFPVKSCAPVRHAACEVTPRGLAGDRRWMLINGEGRFLTGRDHPRLVQLQATVTDDGLSLAASGMAPHEEPRPGADASRQPVQVWGSDAHGRLASPAASAWLSEFLQADVQLLYQHNEDVRPTDEGEAGDQVSFADGFPLLLIGSASLADLNGRLARPVSMDNFRTNLVASTTEPFAEDNWSRVRVGECEFDVVTRCARCVFTTVDPVSATKSADGEPIRTLRSYRFDREARGVMFGMNLIPRILGTVRVGDAIEVLASR